MNKEELQKISFQLQQGNLQNPLIFQACSSLGINTKIFLKPSSVPKNQLQKVRFKHYQKQKQSKIKKILSHLQKSPQSPSSKAPKLDTPLFVPLSPIDRTKRYLQLRQTRLDHRKKVQNNRQELKVYHHQQIQQFKKRLAKQPNFLPKEKQLQRRSTRLRQEEQKIKKILKQRKKQQKIQQEEAMAKPFDNKVIRSQHSVCSATSITPRFEIDDTNQRLKAIDQRLAKSARRYHQRLKQRSSYNSCREELQEKAKRARGEMKTQLEKQIVKLARQLSVSQEASAKRRSKISEEKHIKISKKNMEWSQRRMSISTNTQNRNFSVQLEKDKIIAQKRMSIQLNQNQKSILRNEMQKLRKQDVLENQNERKHLELQEKKRILRKHHQDKQKIYRMQTTKEQLYMTALLDNFSQMGVKQTKFLVKELLENPQLFQIQGAGDCFQEANQQELHQNRQNLLKAVKKSLQVIEKHYHQVQNFSCLQIENSIKILAYTAKHTLKSYPDFWDVFNYKRLLKSTQGLMFSNSYCVKLSVINSINNWSEIQKNSI